MVSIPQVSVIVPAYNVSSYIEDALRSLQRQSFQEFEVLVVDDGSIDRTADVVKPYVEKDSRFRLLQKQNGGLSSARNYGIRYAYGEYIALLDGDDTYHPDKLANHVARLKRDPNVGVVYSASKAIRDDGRPTFMHLSGKPVHSNPLLALLCKNFVGHGSNAVFRRSIVDEVGEFDESLRSSEDVDFWLRISATQKWKFYRESRVLCYYRVRPSGLSFNVAQMQHYNEQVIRNAFLRSPELVEPMLPTAYAYMHRYLARLSLQGGHSEKARYFLDQALAFDKSIFYRDLRSLLTLFAVCLAPIAQPAIRRSLGSVKYMQK
ncbi:glycosyltransferase [Scytonema sp. UIC 10036]|uniref:glycosyltransferase family 2 protein n=1 Tax=Scytonema sp. UIC 10036 TaxID=2304196 RepID=UPI0012DA310B|nr:glycosyltransferase family 2 protein [Scytonema sp. UIC 10036]MUG96099.1 glycosyltransferase [Scytonema sp. UIC 10036]